MPRRCLAALGSYMRNTANASLSFAEFQAGAMATMDLKPRETVMGAYTATHCQELFVVQQFSRFDGKSVSAPTVPALLYPPQSRKHPFPQSGPPPFRQRTSLVSAARRAQPGRPAPIVARIPHLGGNNPVPHAGPRMHDSKLSSSPCPAPRARSIRRSGQGRVASVSVAYERYASGAHDRADSRSQLVRLAASPRRLMRYFGSFSLFFFQLAVMNWIGCLLRRMY